ncbi:hypothetical protein FRC10_007493 [Ceratobasidium sp. 414]|nr:hypothetical protein FRC10_007493 [Ceratobasidium sp. 414]
MHPVDYDAPLYDWQPAPHAFPPHPFAPLAPDFSPQSALLPSAGASPVSASGDSSPWSTASFPTQDVMFPPDLDVSKLNRGSRGSMSSLALPSMCTSHPVPSNARAYTPSTGRPHAMSLSHGEPKEEHPWNLVSWQPFNQDAAAPGTAAFFLRSPTPTKRQRTNQACEKCRERKAKVRRPRTPRPCVLTRLQQCNGARPTCQRCQARGHICEYARERRMRGPNRTGRRGSQDPLDGASAHALADVSETADADSPTSTSSETVQDSPLGGQSKAAESGIRQQPSRARSDSGSPASLASGLPSPPPTARERAASASAPIALPTLSHGNLSLHQPSRLEHRAASSESALRYAQSMPHIGFRYGQDAFLHQDPPTGVWNTTLDAPSMSDSIPMRPDEPHSSPSEYPLSDMQTMHYSVSDVSSSSTPITPDRFEYIWPDEAAAQQNTFQFTHTDSKQVPMLPTLPEFDSEVNTIDPLHGWVAGTHADDQPVIMAENGRRNGLAL